MHVFVQDAPVAERIESLVSYFDGIKDAPKISQDGSTSEVLVAVSNALHLIFCKPDNGKKISTLNTIKIKVQTFLIYYV